MSKSLLTHSISPTKVLRGDGAWIESKKFIPLICKRPLILGRGKATFQIRNSLGSELHSIGLSPSREELAFDCCELDLKRLDDLCKSKKIDAIIASGGGKVLDSGKLLASRLCIPSITVPLSASTCAGWTALSNIYSPSGAFQRDEALKGPPELLIFDHGFVRHAPPRTLASGIADALAKWYEASACSNSSGDGMVQQAVQMARVLRDQLFINAKEAFHDPTSEAWVVVAEGCALTAGLIGGIGGSKCRTAGAHAVHNGLTQLKSSKALLHGEMVGFGILVQLHLEEILTGNQLAKQSRHQLTQLLCQLNLPTSLESLGLGNINNNDLENICEFACQDNSEIYNLPFKVNSKALLESIKVAGLEIQQPLNQKLIRANQLDS